MTKEQMKKKYRDIKKKAAEMLGGAIPWLSYVMAVLAGVTLAVLIVLVVLALTSGCSVREVKQWRKQLLETKKTVNDAALYRVKRETDKIADAIEDDDEEEDND